MKRLFGADPLEKCSLLLDWPGYFRDVADPWYTGNFETTFNDVDAGCTALLEHLKKTHL
jgi:protein-tyrosine phosphatase